MTVLGKVFRDGEKSDDSLMLVYTMCINFSVVFLILGQIEFSSHMKDVSRCSGMGPRPNVRENACRRVQLLSCIVLHAFEVASDSEYQQAKMN